MATLGRVGFDTLGLQTYLTDFQKGFIKAEIVSFDDLVACGSICEARSKSKARIQGKDYVMHGGDVVEFRFNV